ncbi:NYN domain-containing protein [Leptolyngbya sp. FACHB-17]|uniref:LabA-like NYN domain-containing protein n=1 Tax=unclassified Leptolyngbya TaxID=2650499 RepID=UPI001681591A|nr:NYN domain-containing protein [Leptolyngbya sp. FACHB-17]MBD2078973.1 NYN domain-containing protein [Leptolyngbya sp. FACHB-17]
MQLVPRPQRRAASLIDQAAYEPHFPDQSATLREATVDRVAIFIDGSNLFYAAMQLGLEIDYSKLLGYLVGGRRLLRAYFYTGVDPHNEKQQGFLLWMRRHGYRVVTKELIHNADGTRHANLDVEIAVDMLELARYCNTMILLSGDGDLTYAVNTVAYRGVQVEVVSLQTMTSDSLVNVVDRYTDLAKIKSLIQRDELESRAHSIP